MILENPCAKEEADFLVADSGGMIALTPISADATKACDTGVIAYEPWQVMGGSIMVDHRMADDLVRHLQEDGFTIAEE
jgi:triosephosphate isomerase